MECMDDIIRLDTVEQYNTYYQHPTLHPLVSVLDLSKSDPRPMQTLSLGIYCVSLKHVKCGDLVYGKQNYDYQEGTLVFFSPGQVVSMTNLGQMHQPNAQVLVFHPDLLHGTSLATHFHQYSYFSYQVNEGLHMSDAEKSTIRDCYSKIENELHHAIDKHSKKLITSNIEVLLNYCTRFYDRQFITRDKANQGILERLEALLNMYYHSDAPAQDGTPTVGYCASKLNLSANYLGDLVKKETGKTAQELIHAKLIEVAKDKVMHLHKSVSQVSDELGFKYPQHFSRFFKQQVGMTPLEFRSKEHL
jgi:AraC family transcriptional regulator, transcriptional activator of pobA